MLKLARAFERLSSAATMAGAPRGEGVGLEGGSVGYEIGLHGGGSVHAPGGVGKGLHEAGFGGSLGMVFV